MPRIRLNTEQQISTVKSLYDQGLTVQEIANQFGCNGKTVRKALTIAGVTVRSRLYSRNKPDPGTLQREYWDERQASTALAKKYGVGFWTICQWLKEYGIPARSVSEAKKLDMERWSYEDRLRITETSRAIFSGQPRTHKDRCRRAMGVEKKGKLSQNERKLFDALQILGLRPIPQFAIDIFNIDLAFPEQQLAVEIDGGCWHNTPKHVAGDQAKTAFLEANGWRVLRIKTRRQQWVTLAVNAIMSSFTSSR